MSDKNIFFLLLYFLRFSNCHRTLFIPAHDASSHTKTMYNAANELKRRGHDVAVLQLIHDRSQECKNRELIDLIIRTDQHDRDDSLASWLGKIFWSTRATQPLGFLFLWRPTTEVCVRILSNARTKTIFHDILRENWDFVIVDSFVPACGLVAIRKLLMKNATVINYSVSSVSPALLRRSSVYIQSSVSDDFRDPSYHPGRFFYRLWTAIDQFQFDAVLWLIDYFIPYWGRDVEELEDVHIGLLKDNSAFTINLLPPGMEFAHARTLDTIELDLLPCPTSASDTLSEKFKNFIEDPRSRGTIIFALGHFVDWNFAPPGALDAFIISFARLTDYKVIWQFASRSRIAPKNISSNVLVESWIPQTALLNHPKTKVFISHMGLKSMRESICARVPIVAMPMYADQCRNTAIARHRGIAEFLDKTSLSADKIWKTVKRVLDDQRYARAIRKLQDHVGDQIRDPMDLFEFQLSFARKWKEKRIWKKCIKTKRGEIPILASWWNVDAISIFGCCSILCFLIIV